MSETCENYNVRDEYKSMTYNEVAAEQKKLSLPYAAAVMNVQGDLNVGVVMRSATLFGAERFFVLGKRKWDRRSAVGCHNYIEVHAVPAPIEDGVIPRDVLDELCLFYGYYPVFVEQGGYDLQDTVFMHGSYLLRRSILQNTTRKPLFIFGNEQHGISKSYINGDLTVSIEQTGVMRSLNVSAAASIVLHRVYTQLNNAK